jgi:hypothetical protein
LPSENLTGVEGRDEEILEKAPLPFGTLGFIQKAKPTSRGGEIEIHREGVKGEIGVRGRDIFAGGFKGQSSAGALVKMQERLALTDVFLELS